MAEQDVGNGPSVEQVLDAAVSRLGGERRPGQLRMARAVSDAFATGEHLLVQAGTGTGKSLGYLVPSLLAASRVVVATATLTLQHQLVERDIPALLDAATPLLGTRPTYAVLKGRNNYACLHRVRDGVPDDQGTLVAAPSGPLAAEVLELRSWVEGQAEGHGSGDRDAAPAHTDRAWAQVAVSSRECLGASRCPYGQECFAEQAREQAMAADLVVTNHALLAIDALEGIPVLPQHDAVVVDEAHELAARVTSAASAELSPQLVERAARRARAFVSGDEADELAAAGEAFKAAVDLERPGRVDALTGGLGVAVVRLRDSARAAWSAFPGLSGSSGDSDQEAPRRQARSLVEQVRDVAERVAALSPQDVAWVAERDRLRFGNELRVAPLTVAGLLREHLFAHRTAVLTSATLQLGGDFDAVARSVGLRPSERLAVDESREPSTQPGRTASGGREPDGAQGHDTGGVWEAASGRAVEPLPWRGIDVGSPFAYAQQAILYVARALPPPTRDGLGAAQIEEICALVEACGGRALGLFSSRRAAEVATAAVRSRLPNLRVLCQGDEQLSSLREQFAGDPQTSLFGTLSLWQGLDVPGEACQLVLIDKIPFPRPDEPLMAARQRAVDEAGGNGFLTVAAAHAALLLAQGSGRLIRTRTDRGVVAILDPRLVTARYGRYLRASLPPMWPTTDRDVALAALRRLSGSDPPEQAG
jgi:ATP-dependent DNA helicase DinG